MLPPRQLLADLILVVIDGEVKQVKSVPWLNEEVSDIAVFTRRRDGMMRWWGVKILGTPSPWGGFSAAEKYFARFDDVEYLYMLHDVVFGYGRF